MCGYNHIKTDAGVVLLVDLEVSENAILVRTEIYQCIQLHHQHLQTIQEYQHPLTTAYWVGEGKEEGKRGEGKEEGKRGEGKEERGKGEKGSREGGREGGKEGGREGVEERR